MFDLSLFPSLVLISQHLDNREPAGNMGTRAKINREEGHGS